MLADFIACRVSSETGSETPHKFAVVLNGSGLMPAHRDPGHRAGRRKLRNKPTLDQTRNRGGNRCFVFNPTIVWTG